MPAQASSQIVKIGARLLVPKNDEPSNELVSADQLSSQQYATINYEVVSTNYLSSQQYATIIYYPIGGLGAQCQLEPLRK